jgi:hypothetical protein
MQLLKSGISVSNTRVDSCVYICSTVNSGERYTISRNGSISCSNPSALEERYLMYDSVVAGVIGKREDVPKEAGADQT